MTVEQKQWTEKKAAQLRAEIDRKWPLSDPDWEALVAAVGRLIELAKGNQEVRRVLFDLMEEYEIREQEERAGMRKNSEEGGHEGRGGR